MKKTSWPGNWKMACQRCGFWYPSSEIKKEWTGLLVCEKDWEPRHPQTLIQVRAETSVPTMVSKDSSPDIFVQMCSIQGTSAYADLSVADCAQADSTRYTYEFLRELDTNGHTIV